MISLKVLIGVTIFLSIVIMALLIWIAVLRSDLDTARNVNKWLNEDLAEANARFKLAMGLPVDVSEDETRPWLYRPRNEEPKYDGYMGLG